MSLVEIFGIRRNLQSLIDVAGNDFSRGQIGEFKVVIKYKKSGEVGNEDDSSVDARVEVGYYNPKNFPIFWRFVPRRIINVIKTNGPIQINAYKYKSPWYKLRSFMTEEERERVRKEVYQLAEYTVDKLKDWKTPVEGIIFCGTAKSR